MRDRFIPDEFELKRKQTLHASNELYDKPDFLEFHLQIMINSGMGWLETEEDNDIRNSLAISLEAYQKQLDELTGMN